MVPSICEQMVNDGDIDRVFLLSFAITVSLPHIGSIRVTTDATTDQRSAVTVMRSDPGSGFQMPIMDSLLPHFRSAAPAARHDCQHDGSERNPVKPSGLQVSDGGCNNCDVCVAAATVFAAAELT